MRLATSRDSSTKYAYSFMVCQSACRDLARRYVHLRVSLPSGFFASRVLDIQALTAAIFLLSTTYGSNEGQQSFRNGDGNAVMELIRGMTQTMDSVSNKPTGDFARKAAAAIRSLEHFLASPSTTESQSLSLKLPLLGKLQVSRRNNPQSNASGPIANTMQPQGGDVPSTTGPSAGWPLGYNNDTTMTSGDLLASDTGSWLMQLSNEPPFLDDFDSMNTWPLPETYFTM
jgi:hypothetical protein